MVCKEKEEKKAIDNSKVRAPNLSNVYILTSNYRVYLNRKQVIKEVKSDRVSQTQKVNCEQPAFGLNLHILLLYKTTLCTLIASV